MRVLGFDRGRIEVRLEKTSFSPGETINGTVFLKVKKPLEARKVKITLDAERRVKEPRIDLQGKITRVHRKERVYNFTTNLEGEKEFSECDYEYPFEILIPENVMEKDNAPEGVLGNILKTVKFTIGFSSYTKWELTASVDIPGASDFSHFVCINVK